MILTNVCNPLKVRSEHVCVKEKVVFLSEILLNFLDC